MMVATGPIPPGMGIRVFCFGQSVLKPGHQFQIDKPWSKPLWHRVSSVREILYKEIGNGIFPVNHIEYFKCGPNIFQIPEGIMASPVRFIIIQQAEH